MFKPISYFMLTGCLFLTTSLAIAGFPIPPDQSNLGAMRKMQSTYFMDFYHDASEGGSTNITEHQFTNQTQTEQSAGSMASNANAEILRITTDPILKQFITYGNYLPGNDAAYCAPGFDTWTMNENGVPLKPKFSMESKYALSCKEMAAYSYYKQQYAHNGALRAGTLLNPNNSNISKPMNANPAALDFIAFAGGTADNFTMKRFLKETDPNKFSAALSKNKDYVTQLRSYLARLSVGLHAMYQVYVDNLANIANPVDANGNRIVSNAGNYVSHDQLLTYMATHRLQDPNWGKQLQDAGPAALARQQTMMQAEQLYEMDQIRHQLQTLNTTMATMQLQLLAQQKQMMSQGSAEQ